VVDEPPGETQQVVDRRAGGLAAEDDMKLGGDDDDADPCDHAVHHRGRDGQRRPADPQRTEADLDHAGSGGDRAGCLPAVPRHQLGDHEGEPGRGAGDLQRRATEEGGDDPADSGRHQAGAERSARRHGDAQRERNGDEHDHHGCGQVAAEIRCEAVASSTRQARDARSCHRGFLWRAGPGESQRVDISTQV
jgi:hypothetical protein